MEAQPEDTVFIDAQTLKTFRTLILSGAALECLFLLETSVSHNPFTKWAAIVMSFFNVAGIYIARRESLAARREQARERTYGVGQGAQNQRYQVQG